MASRSANYLPHVDGLRAIAVAAVLLFHLGVGGCDGGFVGVDVFLVISGYLITRLIADEIAATGRFRFGAFYLRRVRRLAPALLVASLATFAFCAAAFSPGMLARTAAELVAAVASVSNVHFWLAADYFDVSATTRPLLHTWSLSVEEQFYLVWPALLLWTSRRLGARKLPAALLAVGAASLAANPAFADGAPGWLARWLPEAADNGKSTVFYLLPFRVFEFTVGGWLALANAGPATRGWRAEAACVAGLAAMAAAIVAFDEGMLFPSFAGLLPCAGAALVVRWGGAARIAGWLASRPVVHLGRISYSVYLWHWPVIVLTQYVSGPLGPFGMAGAAMASLALGHVSWRFVETPFRERRLPLWPIAVAAVVAIALGWHASRDGWPARVQPAVAESVAGDPADHHRQEYGGSGHRNGLASGATPVAFLLIGDSHGKQYAEGLVREVAEPRELGVWIEAGTSCLHLPGFVRRTAGQDWSALLERQLRVIRAALAAQPVQPVVVLAQAWMTQSARSALVDGGGNALEREIRPEDLVAGIVRLREECGVRRLVVIGQAPRPPHDDLYEELTRPAWSRRIDPEAARTFAPSAKAQAWNEALRAGAERTGAYEFLDPIAALSEDGSCLAIDGDGRLVYSDDSHLSKAGSRRAMRAFAERLAATAAAR